MSKSLGIVFPGQGSQYSGMLEKHFDGFVEFNKVFDQSKEILGLNFKDMIQNGSSEDLTPTEITQPLLLTANYALWKVCNIDPKNVTVMAGHSLGEYSALLAAKSLIFEDALMLVSLRAKYMQKAVKEGEGGIAAIIGLSIDQLSQICENITSKGNLVSMANINSDNQIVISGTKKGVDAAIEICKESGAKRAIPLAMSVPSHCELMKPASIEFANELNKIQFKEPQTKIIQNFSVAHTNEIENIKQNLVSQLHSPVKWSETMDLFHEMELNLFYECGPSKVLTGLVKRKFVDTEIFSFDDYNTLDSIKGD